MQNNLSLRMLFKYTLIYLSWIHYFIMLIYADNVNRTQLYITICTL